MLFPIPLWGFERIHPSGFAPALIQRLVDNVSNIVAIKAEGGYPTIAGFVETYKKLSDRVVVTCPLEADGIPLAALVPMPFMGTSNYGTGCKFQPPQNSRRLMSVKARSLNPR
jgi:4-hydroxy-tetrahydrodipicolinate synthase